MAGVTLDDLCGELAKHSLHTPESTYYHLPDGIMQSHVGLTVRLRDRERRGGDKAFQRVQGDLGPLREPTCGSNRQVFKGSRMGTRQSKRPVVLFWCTFPFLSPLVNICLLLHKTGAMHLSSSTPNPWPDRFWHKRDLEPVSEIHSLLITSR